MECFLQNGNRDIEKFVPQLVECIAVPAKTTDCIHALAATTFVQQVQHMHVLFAFECRSPPNMFACKIVLMFPALVFT